MSRKKKEAKQKASTRQLMNTKAVTDYSLQTYAEQLFCLGRRCVGDHASD